MNNTEFTESILPTEVTGFANPTSSARISGINIPLQVPTKTIRSSSNVHNDPTTAEKITSENNSSGVTSHQCQVQNTATLPFSQFKGSQTNIKNF